MAKKAVPPMHPRSGPVVEGGNINLMKRPVAKRTDGVISTEDSMSFRDGRGHEILIPTIVKGRKVSDLEAKKHYVKTGQHMGKFKTPQAADKYAAKTHREQDKLYNRPRSKLLVPKSKPRRRT